MAEPIVIPAGGGEVIGDAPDRTVLVLSECDELHATWSRFGPGRDGAGLHIHYHHTDLFYVLEGELTVKVAEDDAITGGRRHAGDHPAAWWSTASATPATRTSST